MTAPGRPPCMDDPYACPGPGACPCAAYAADVPLPEPDDEPEPRPIRDVPTRGLL